MKDSGDKQTNSDSDSTPSDVIITTPDYFNTTATDYDIGTEERSFTGTQYPSEKHYIEAGK